MKIEWVNHASFIVDTGKIRLITDPWLFGPAFNNGWDLLLPSVFTPEDFKDITHIWMSHEHPDHFSPQVLNKIPTEYRGRIKFCYQSTIDGKVKNWAKRSGFNVMEMTPYKTYIEGSLALTCAPIKDDSWLYIEDSDSGLSILNTNDCIIDTPEIAESIKKHTPIVDILMTQFSYANWCGNPKDHQQRRDNAAEKMRRIKMQVETFKPRFVFPFASFVRFSHIENSYMNDEVASPVDVCNEIRSWKRVRPMMLLPGEVWEAEEKHDPIPAAEVYENAIGWAASTTLRTSKDTPMIDLSVAGKLFVSKIANKNSVFWLKVAHLLRVLRPAKVWLWDKKGSVDVGLLCGVEISQTKKHECDIEMGSESLHYALLNEWGGDTLHVNGRFHTVGKNSYLNFFMLFLIPSHNNAGRSFPWGVLRSYAQIGTLKKMIGRFLSLKKGCVSSPI